MFAVVPVLGAFTENMVIILLGFFEESFEADITSDFVAMLIKRE
jgi:hypothetical protein